jgi:hypothetical protein
MSDPEPELAGPQAPASVAPIPSPGGPVLDATQRALLRAALNEIVPARADLPGAGDLDVGDAIERTLVASPPLRRLFLHGLAELGVARFLELSGAARVEALKKLEAEQPAFFAALVEHTYRGYYTLPEVHAAIGYVGPPQPRGGVLPPFDPHVLDVQRRREPFWRRA